MSWVLAPGIPLPLAQGSPSGALSIICMVAGVSVLVVGVFTAMILRKQDAASMDAGTNKRQGRNWSRIALFTACGLSLPCFACVILIRETGPTHGGHVRIRTNTLIAQDATTGKAIPFEIITSEHIEDPYAILNVTALNANKREIRWNVTQEISVESEGYEAQTVQLGDPLPESLVIKLRKSISGTTTTPK